MSRAVCVACRHEIDAVARLCPYCGADPHTGEKVDTQAVVQEVFQPRKISTTEGLIEYARQRQGLVIAAAILVVFLLLGGVHQFITRRNQALSDATAVPLTDVADLNNQPEETTKPLPMPEMQFQYDGHPQTMRTLITEPGAITPPEVAAEQRQQPSGAPAPSPAAQPPAQPPNQ